MKPLIVLDQYRKNPLSTKPGGVRVMVKYELRPGVYSIRIYDNVKKPLAYMKVARKDPKVVDAWIDPVDGSSLIL